MSRRRRGTDPARFALIHYGAPVFSVRRLLTLLALLLGLTKLCACSQALDTQVRQCESNDDCVRFGEAVCDLAQQICVPRPAVMKPDAQTSADAGVPATACQGRNGCFSCAPSADPEYFNACTDSRCIPFDNRRLHNLTADGMLKPLP
jgi:hypothetical protein